MSSTLFWTALSSILVLLLFIKLSLRLSTSLRTRPAAPTEIRSSHPQQCAAIIAAKSFVCPEGGHAIKNTLSALEARALPNERLIRAFGIHNSFVTSQKGESDAFRQQVETLLYVEANKWVEFAALARDVVRAQLDTRASSLKLSELVQLVTLKMVRKVVWDLEPDVAVRRAANEDDQLRILARAISSQWLASKEEQVGVQDEKDSAAVQEQMRQALMAAFPDWDGSDMGTTPLNFILPAYETMWRVVLLCFLEIVARPHPRSAEWATALRTFLETPTREVLETRAAGTDGPLSAIMVAKEVLRLYPPTRRVYRHFQDADGVQYSVAADIEAMQRDPAVWGEDAALFQPERWSNITQAMEDDGRWLPFGAKPFRCPAKKHTKVAMPFGVSMIALLTGALLEATEGKWEYSGDVPAIDVPLETGREAYDDVELLKLGQASQT